MNGDTMFDANFSDAYTQFLEEPNNPLLIVKSQNDNTRYQSYILGKIKVLITNSERRIHINGCILREKKALRTKQLLRDTPMSIDESFLAHERIRPYILGRDSFFIDIGVPECYKKAQKLIPNFIKDAMQ